MRALSSSSVRSLSSNLGGSFPIRRAVPFLAMSQAICTCLVSGNMSGARRAFASTAPSKDFAFACAMALSKIFANERSMGTKVSIVMVWIEHVIRTSSWNVTVGWVERSETHHETSGGFPPPSRRSTHPTQMSRRLLLAVDHPGRAEPIGEHAETLCPEGFLDRHAHVSLLRQGGEDAIGFRRFFDAQRHRESFHAAVVAVG